MNALLTHLWVSTLLLAVALVCARFLPLTARTRYALVLCGLLKFIVPAEAILEPLKLAGIDLANLGRQTNGIISIQWLGGPLTVSALRPQPSSIWPEALLAAWIMSAIALAAAWAVARHRLVRSALSAASPASTRERDALSAARRRLRLSASIEITRSTICEAPAVVRIIRPVVVLPDGGCDALEDSELESLLRHECAHVARRDNLLGLIESAIVAAFWFNPVVWIAQRALATAREEACDETAAATSESIDTYVSALSKICRAVLAPRLTGVSCMASAHLKERLNHLMRYELLRKRALSHSAVVAVATVAMIAVAVGSGLHAAPSSGGSEDPFALQFTVRPGDALKTLEFSGRVIEVATGLTVARPGAVLKPGSNVRIQTTAEERDVTIDVRDQGKSVRAVMRVFLNGVKVQESAYSVATEPDGPRNAHGRRYTGAPISITVKDAEIKDILRTFSRIIGTNITYPPDLEGRVNLDVRDMPWDEAFDVVLRQHNLRFELDGKSIHVKR